MEKKQWMPQRKSAEETILALFAFFGIGSVRAWEDYYLNQKLKVVFRLSLAHSQDAHAISAWLRMGERQAVELRETPLYSATEFAHALGEVKSLVVGQPEDFFSSLQAICLRCGAYALYSQGCGQWGYKVAQ